MPKTAVPGPPEPSRERRPMNPQEVLALLKSDHPDVYVEIVKKVRDAEDRIAEALK